jgi:hypothetical protein
MHEEELTGLDLAVADNENEEAGRCVRLRKYCGVFGENPAGKLGEAIIQFWKWG